MANRPRRDVAAEQFLAYVAGVCFTAILIILGLEALLS